MLFKRESRKTKPKEITEEIRRHLFSPIKRERSLKDIYGDDTIIVGVQTSKGIRYNFMSPTVAEYFLNHLRTNKLF